MKKMLYPGYVWITYGWYYNSAWWKTDNYNDSCTDDEISQSLIGAIALSHYPVPFDEQQTNNVYCVSTHPRVFCTKRTLILNSCTESMVVHLLAPQ